MIGMNRINGRELAGEDHLQQSIRDILTTPVGSRVMRRTYGSELPRLIDAPISGATIIDLFAATAEALDLWEPRLRLTRVEIVAARPGHVTLLLNCETAAGRMAINAEVAA